jgi:hypothetical protein
MVFFLVKPLDVDTACPPNVFAPRLILTPKGLVVGTINCCGGGPIVLGLHYQTLLRLLQRPHSDHARLGRRGFDLLVSSEQEARHTPKVSGSRAP